MVYKKLLAENGYEIEISNNEDELIQRLNKEIPDIILLDVNLPGKNGFEILSDLKKSEKYKDILVVMISSIFKEPECLIDGLKKGADGYIVRPINNMEFLARIDSLKRLKQTLDELKKSEAKLRKIISENPDPIIITDENDIIIFVNNSAEKIFRKNNSQIIGINFGFPITGKDKSEIDIIEPDGKILTAEMRVVNIEYDGEKSYMLTLRDVTDKHEMMNKLKEYSLQLEKTNSAKDKMFSLISHDLRSPYQNTLLITEMLENDIDDLKKEEIVNLSKMLNKIFTNQLMLVDDLLAWAKIQTGKYKIKKEKIDLNDLLIKLSELLKSILEKKEITLTFNIKDSCNVYSDRISLTSIIKNLIENAVKFSYRGGKIEISSEIVSNKNLIKVKDYGVGISEEHIRMLFTTGENVTTLGTEQEKGNGIGLLLINEMAIMLGGELRVESVVGEGSTFIVELPCETE